MADKSGRLQQLTRFGPGYYASYPSWSPDGKKIAFIISHYFASADLNYIDYDLYTMNIDGSGQKRLTFYGKHKPNQGVLLRHPSWSPDSQKIAYAYSPYPAVESRIYSINADGSGNVKLTNGGEPFDTSPSWSPDGKSIAFKSGSLDDSYGYLNTMNANGTNRKKLGTLANVISTNWSPDGKKIAIEATQGYVVKASDGSFLGQLNLGGAPALRPCPLFD